MTAEQRAKNEVWVEKMRERLRLKHYAYKTEKSYCSHVRRYLAYVWGLPRDWSSERKVEDWLSSMKDDVSGSTQNGALQAVLFFYTHVRKVELKGIDALRAKGRETVKFCPTVKEVAAVLPAVQEMRAGNPTRLMVKLIYATGMRLGECIKLRVHDFRFDQGIIEVHQPKHNHDRVVPLPAELVPELRLQFKRARLVHEADKMDGIPVSLPDGLSKKYRNACFDFGWFFMFPQFKRSNDPRDGKLKRWHCMESAIQRALKEAVLSVGVDGRLTPHTLRHACATHLLARGVDIRTVQELLGHRNVQTTMGYCHASQDRLPSLLGSMGAACVPPVQEEAAEAVRLLEGAA